MPQLILFGAIIANLLTNIGFKYSALNDHIPAKKWSYLAIGLVFGLINSVLFTESLKFVTLNVASAIFFSLTILGLTLLSMFWFGEAYTTRQLVGVAVIIAGVVLVSL